MKSKRATYPEAYQAAMRVIDCEWQEAGMSQKEMEQNRQLVELLDLMRASGRTLDDILSEWQGKSADEILSEYMPSLPELRAV